MHEVKRIQNASKLQWDKSKSIKDHILCLLRDLHVVYMHNSSFLAFHGSPLSTLLFLYFDPKWLRTKKIIKDSYFQGRSEFPMSITSNLKIMEFRTYFLSKSGFRVYEVKRIHSSFILLWHKSKSIKDHILCFLWDLHVVFMHNSSFLAFHRSPLATLLYLNFDPKWLRTKKIIEDSYFQDRFEYRMWISYNLWMVEFRTYLLPKSGFRAHEVKRIQNASKL